MFEGLELPIAETEKMIIRHPSTGKPIVDKDGNEAYIELRSSDSKEGLAAKRKVLNKRLKRKEKTTAETIEEDEAELLASLVVDWYLVNAKGEHLDIKADHNTVKKFMQDDSVAWIRQQIDLFAGDVGNFLSQ